MQHWQFKVSGRSLGLLFPRRRMQARIGVSAPLLLRDFSRKLGERIQPFARTKICPPFHATILVINSHDVDWDSSICMNLPTPDEVGASRDVVVERGMGGCRLVELD